MTSRCSISVRTAETGKNVIEQFEGTAQRTRVKKQSNTHTSKEEYQMKVVYASRTGNVQKLIDRLGIEATKIENGSEKVDGDYLLITYTDGKGIIPPAVDKFIAANKDGLKAAAVSGNKERHPDTYVGAADELKAKYGVEIVATFNKEGDEETDAAIKKALA